MHSHLLNAHISWAKSFVALTLSPFSALAVESESRQSNDLFPNPPNV